MENSSYNLPEQLSRKYRLSEQAFFDIFQIIIEEITDGYLPSRTPKAVILGAQPGAGKSELQKEAEIRLRDNAVICNADNLRDFHPLSIEIKSEHPELYSEITALYAQKWNDLLCRYCRENRLNYILETTFSSGNRLNGTIKELKESRYEVDIMLLAVSPRLSLLGTYIRYEQSLAKQGLGRRVSREAHDVRFNAIPDTINAITKNKLFDNIYIYSRSIVLEYTSLVEGVTLVAHNPRNIREVFEEEINRPWTSKLKEYFRDSCNQVFVLMRNRDAHPREIEHFRSEMKITLPPSQKKGRGLGR